MVERTGAGAFGRLMERSRYGVSESVLTDEPIPLTGPNWATLYTGAIPEVHGITDAGWLLENKKYQDIRVNTVFDIVDRRLTQSLMTLPLTYPAFPVNGWMVSGFPSPKSLKDCFYPEEIGGLLAPGFAIDLAKCARGMSWDRIEDRAVKLKLKDTFLGLARGHVATFKKIQQARPTEIAFVGLTYIDRMNHLFTQEQEPLAEAYREVFEMIDDLIRFCRPDHLIVCSDHGFAPSVREHDLFGFYLINSPDFKTGRKDVPITEIAPVVLEILDLDEKLGLPVEREKTRIRPGKLREIKQRLAALGYI